MECFEVFFFYTEVLLRIINVQLFSEEKNLISICSEDVSFSVVNIFDRVKGNTFLCSLRH